MSKPRDCSHTKGARTESCCWPFPPLGSCHFPRQGTDIHFRSPPAELGATGFPSVQKAEPALTTDIPLYFSVSLAILVRFPIPLLFPGLHFLGLSLPPSTSCFSLHFFLSVLLDKWGRPGGTCDMRGGLTNSSQSKSKGLLGFFH